MIGGAALFAPGFIRGFRKGKKLDNLVRSLYSGSVYKFAEKLEKTSALKPGVSLRDHQKDLAHDRIVENNGSLLVAHATGTGKTLTGIAAYEHLKSQGKAKRAVVVVPASLRSNFVENGVRKFTNSSFAVYGPKGESSSKDVSHKSKADYNIISYDLFRQHGDKILQNTGADTLIMDEVHKARADEGVTYNKLKDLRQKVKNAITLTGSVVNNEPNEVVPLLDITYGPTGHKLVNKKFFDNLFVQKDAVTEGLLFPKTVVDKKLKNKSQLSKYLAGKIDYISHEDLEKHLPKKNLSVVEVPMSDKQTQIYNFTLSSVDPVTRWKIRNNLPVGQREAAEAFGKLLQARQVSTDPSIMDKDLAKHPDPATYSPKIRKVVEDLKSHLDAHESNKSVIFGNLLEGQLKSVAKSLETRGIPYTTFFGVGNEGNSAKKREQSIRDFQEGGKRVLLISGAGAEGLDLKDANLLQMLEGHYNPERIHQAESRIRRMGSPLKEVHVKRYVSVPRQGFANSFLRKATSGSLGGDKGVDNWIYTVAERKNDLNKEFRSVLDKNLTKKAAKRAVDMGWDARWSAAEGLRNEYTNSLPAIYGQRLGEMTVGALVAAPMRKRSEKAIERRVKQILLDRGHETLTKKMHLPKVLAESKLDEKALDAGAGAGAVGFGLGILSAMNPSVSRAITEKAIKYTPSFVTRGLSRAAPKKVRYLMKNPLFRQAATAVAVGTGLGIATPILKEYIRGSVLDSSIHPESKDMDVGINRYMDKLRRKHDRKYKSSKSFVHEYEVKKELGIDDPT